MNYQLSFRRLLSYAVCVGILIGCLATAYYFVLQWGIRTVWTTFPNQINWNPDNFANYAWIFTTIGGFLVGLTVHYLGAPTGINAAIEEIHHQGRIEYQQTPGMIVASLLSLIFGSSAGPESPLVDINGSVGSWLGDKLKLSQENTRVLTFCGMGSALGAFFGSPLGSAILALELPHRFGLEYYEAFIPTLVSTIISFGIFRTLTGHTIISFYNFPAIPNFHPKHLLFAVALGLIGAGIAKIFVLIFNYTQKLIKSFKINPILLTTLGGLSIGLIAKVFPLTLFYGEKEIQTIIDTGHQIGWQLLLIIAIAKMFTVSISLHSGFRGGFIFPIFFIGAAIGVVVNILVPTIPVTFTMLGMMAAVTVGIMKTPVSIPIVLSVLSDTNLIPLIVVVSTVSFLATMKTTLITTQQGRISPESSFST